VKQKDFSAWLSSAFTLLAALACFLQLRYYARTQASVLDEGLYLVKGWLFAAGRYVPYQPYGPWMNQMPLSYIIPGWVQEIFGAGLRTGRGFAVALGMLAVLGVWALARRFTGAAMLHAASPRTCLPALAVWAIALNPALLKIYSVQASQGLGACLLIWALVFTLHPESVMRNPANHENGGGEGKPSLPSRLPHASLFFGGVLAGLLPLVRINLLPVLPALVLYAFWAHGRRGGWYTLAGAAAAFLGGHAAFWPGILRNWAPYFPQALTPFLDPFRRPDSVIPLWQPEISPASRLLAFVQGVRYHFVPLLGAAGTLLFWRRARQRAAAYTLLALFGILFLAHALASLAQSYCVFCFTPYLAFFSLTGLVVAAITLPDWDWARPARLVPAAVILLALGVGWSAWDSVGAAWLRQPAVVQIVKTEIPMSGGTIPLWGLLENKFGWDYESIVRGGQLWGRVAISMLIALSGAGLILWGARCMRGRASRGGRAFLSLLFAGLLLSPTAYLGGGYRTYDCGGDVIAAYEAAGAHLNARIPAGADIYWGTGESPIPLLYLPDAELHPAQLNGLYSYKAGGAPDALHRHGLWSRELAQQWAAEADAILVSPGLFREAGSAWLADLLTSGAFTELDAAPPVHPCDANSRILIFVRK
jgi:hypothetical protein